MARKTDEPIIIKTIVPVKRCSITPRNLGFSPGTAVSDSFFKLITWFIDKTVAATNQGMPINELIIIVMATINKSR